MCSTHYVANRNKNFPLIISENFARKGEKFWIIVEYFYIEIFSSKNVFYIFMGFLNLALCYNHKTYFKISTTWWDGFP